MKTKNPKKLRKEDEPLIYGMGFKEGKAQEQKRIIKIIDKWLANIPRNLEGEKPITPEDLFHLSNLIKGDEE